MAEVSVKSLIELIMGSISRLEGKVDTLTLSVTEHHAKDDEKEKREEEKCEKIKMLYEDIHGNGKDGLKKEFDSLNFKVTALKKVVDESLGGVKRFMWIAVSAGVTAVIAAVVTVIKDTITK